MGWGNHWHHLFMLSVPLCTPHHFAYVNALASMGTLFHNKMPTMAAVAAMAAMTAMAVVGIVGAMGAMGAVGAVAVEPLCLCSWICH